MRHQDALELRRTSAVAPPAPAAPSMTKADMIATVIAAFRKNGNKLYGTMKNIEGTNLAVLREMSVANNAMGFVVSTLQDHQVPIEQTAGSVMSVLDIGKDQLHDLVCFCLENSDVVSGSSMADRFNALQDGTLCGYRQSMAFI